MRRCRRPSGLSILSGFCLLCPLVSDPRDKTQEDAGLRIVSVVKGEVRPKSAPSPSRDPQWNPRLPVGEVAVLVPAPRSPRGAHTGQVPPWVSRGAPHLLPLLVLPGVDVEAAKRAEEELLLHDTRCWLNGGAMPEARHPRTGASALHVAAAKGYIEVMR